MEYKEGGVRSSQAEDLSEQVRNDRGEELERETLTDRNRAGATERTEQPDKAKEESDAMTEDEQARLKELQMQNFDLRVQLEGQKYLVGKYDDLVSGERERHEREKLALVDRLTDARHQIGSLEEKLLRLDAPKALVRDVETGNRDEVYRTDEPDRRGV